MEVSLACNEKMWSVEEDEGNGTASSSAASSTCPSSGATDDLNFDGLKSVVDRRYVSLENASSVGQLQDASLVLN